MQQLIKSHKTLLLVTMAYKETVLDKLKPPFDAKTLQAKQQIENVIAQAIKAEKSIA
jgi:hypothetical protein